MYMNPDEFVDYSLFNENKDLEINWSFTYIKFIHQWILLFSLSGIILVGLPMTCKESLVIDYFTSVIVRWVLTSGFYLVFYLGFENIK